jgi:hypothetical protein
LTSGNSESDRETYRNREFRLFEILPTARSAVLENLAFEDCTILGPAIALPQASTFVECTFKTHHGDIESILWEVAESKPRVSGVIVLRGCRFIRCTFEGIGFAGKRAELDALRASIKFS